MTEIAESKPVEYTELHVDLSVQKLSTSNMASSLSPEKVEFMLKEETTFQHQKDKNVCDHCGRIFPHAEQLETHHKWAHGVNMYSFVCQTCNECFTNEWFQWNHISVVHPEVANKLKCRDCGKQFKNKPAFIRHTVIVHKPFLRNVLRLKSVDAQEAIIKLSQRSSASKVGVENPIAKAKAKKNKKAGLCNICGKFVNKKAYELHELRHYIFVTFRRKRAMKDLVAFFCEKDKVFKCNQCDEKFEFGDGFEQHLTKKHFATITGCTWTKPLFRCKFCANVYRQDKLLTEHVQQRHCMAKEKSETLSPRSSRLQNEDIDSTDASETSSDDDEYEWLFNPPKPPVFPDGKLSYESMSSRLPFKNGKFGKPFARNNVL